MFVEPLIDGAPRELAPGDPGGKSQVVLDLAARPRLSSRCLALDENGGESFRAPVHGRCQPRGTGPDDSLGLVVACGRIQATYAGGPGLFDLLQDALVMDFSDSPKMRNVFESLIDERGALGSARHDEGAHEPVPRLGNRFSSICPDEIRDEATPGSVSARLHATWSL